MQEKWMSVLGLCPICIYITWVEKNTVNRFQFVYCIVLDIVCGLIVSHVVYPTWPVLNNFLHSSCLSRVVRDNHALINTIIFGTIIEQTDNREVKHEAPTSDDENSRNKRPKLESDEIIEIAEDPQGWADEHHHNDDNEDDFFKSVNERLGKCVLLRFLPIYLGSSQEISFRPHGKLRYIHWLKKVHRISSVQYKYSTLYDFPSARGQISLILMSDSLLWY